MSVCLALFPFRYTVEVGGMAANPAGLQLLAGGGLTETAAAPGAKGAPGILSTLLLWVYLGGGGGTGQTGLSNCRNSRRHLPIGNQPLRPFQNSAEQQVSHALFLFRTDLLQSRLV